ncbi:TMEM175 family protein [Methanothermobacter sp.]|uniref:TMEM175 family protein n=1 Tax=Methanothermobacter sp. TaxID=1884223 RepID=UPI003C794037
MNKNRIEGLVDGIFAIAMTILVLGIEVPAGITTESSMFSYLTILAPQIYIYCLSFFLLGIFWRVNHMQFENLKEVDTGFLWINIFWLMFVAMVPFSTELTGDYGEFVTSNIIFHLNMLMVGILLSVSWFYAYRNGLVDVEKDHYLRALKMNMLMPFAAILALIITPFKPEYSSIAYAIMILKRFL